MRQDTPKLPDGKYRKHAAITDWSWSCLLRFSVDKVQHAGYDTSELPCDLSKWEPLLSKCANPYGVQASLLPLW